MDTSGSSRSLCRWVRSHARAHSPALGMATAILVAAVLRLIWAGDMEFKLDEEYMFSRLLGVTAENWPWLGMPSGVHLRNPGMSVWIFLFLGRLIGATEPTQLARAVQLLNVSAIALTALFAWFSISREEREPWLWAVAVAAVNPLAVMYDRKIWAQSVLPFFSMLFLIAWWRRDRKAGAFAWGLVGACLGQIHMSGFFFAAAFALWTLLFRRTSEHGRIRWTWWILGSCVGAIPLIPWILHLASGQAQSAASHGFGEAVQLKLWVFWLTDPFGLHLGNALGVHRGDSLLSQLSDFLRYPLIGGHATYLLAGAHVLLALLLATLVVSTIRGTWRRIQRSDKGFFRALAGLAVGDSETAFAQNTAIFAYGSLLTVSTIMIRRYYLLITFPLEFVWLARQFLLNLPRARARLLLAVLILCELTVSIGFLGYIHANGGAIQGDYGRAYRLRTLH